MAPSTELDYLKSLVAQLNNKIAALEAKAKSDVPPTPMQQLRTILIGPPGAGARRENHHYYSLRFCLMCWNRQRDTSSTNSRQILRMSPGYWRHATGTSCSENTSRSWGKEGHGCRGSGQRWYYGENDQRPAGEQQGLQKWVSTTFHKFITLGTFLARIFDSWILNHVIDSYWMASPVRFRRLKSLTACSPPAKRNSITSSNSTLRTSCSFLASLVVWSILRAGEHITKSSSMSWANIEILYLSLRGIPLVPPRNLWLTMSPGSP